jgi:hypothetical protein
MRKIVWDGKKLSDKEAGIAALQPAGIAAQCGHSAY